MQSQPDSKSTAADHRTRVGALRREKMRARLVESAFLVVARFGVDAGVIDRVITEAKVSRGTFYNYFKTDREMFIAVATEVGNEILRIVDPVVQRHEDAASRIACGIRMVLEMATSMPLLADFIVRGGPESLRYSSLVTEVVPRDLRMGWESGQFIVEDPTVAHDLLMGPVYLAFHSISLANVQGDFSRNLARGVLMSLGVGVREAESICLRPVPLAVIPDDSLFAKALRRNEA